MYHPTPPRFRATLVALAASAALAPHAVWAIDLVQAPPGTVRPYVAPNVIVSIDDSGSMAYRLNSSSSGDTSIKEPKPDGTWDPKAPRINILKYSLNQVFNDKDLLPDGKIRLAWQAMWNNGNSPGVGPVKSTYAGATSVDSTTSGVNSMKVLDSTHRADFLSFVDKLKANGNTPSHWMFSQADSYMRQPLGVNSPWASVPGSVGEPYLACRRNYHIMMTDGRWNSSPSGGSRDDNTKNKTLPDGTVYGSTNAAARPYNKLYSDEGADTLADWAFHSWADPLQTSGLTGTMQPNTEYLNAPTVENFGNDTAGNPAILERFWNPRYNPANWPHMVTFAIGASSDATTWPGASNINAPTEQVPFGYDGSFPDFVTGTRTWPVMNNENRRALDLWHAALNGRGRFYAVNKAEDMEKAFRDIVEQINKLVEPELTSTATSGSNISRTDVGKFTGNYEPKNAWKGFVTAETVKTDGTTEPTVTWGGKNTADRLDDPSFSITNRLILSWSDEWVTSKDKGGVQFKWASDGSYLSTAQNALLGKDPGDTTVTVATNAENRLNYIRGDRTLEGSDTSGYTVSKPFRERKSRQGDVINSVVWYTGAPASNYPLKGYSAFTLERKSRTPMIYVGGNDGMLHGFSAVDGTERIAYAPRGVIASLPLLTDPVYNQHHRFFVDGSPMTGDVDLGVGDPSDPTYAPNWRTYLVGAMGAGGKGYFVLDVTNPESADSAGGLPGFSSTNANKLVVLDRTRGTEAAPNCATMTGAQQAACNTAVAEDKDIGYITARPVLDESNAMRTTQITRMNNDRWAAVVPNGYNSANQRPVLLIQYLDGSKELKRIPTTSDAPGTGNAKDNGLSAPRLVDLNGDGRPDIAYAGDNLGNMWKFDLTSMNDSDWGVAFGGVPLFTAEGSASLGSARTLVQPITAPPTVRANDRMKTVSGCGPIAVGGMMVAFGTGRNVTKADENDANVQTLYSVLDNTRYRYRDPVPGIGKRLEVHPGEAGSCAELIPAPTALGKGVTTAKLAKQTINAVDATSDTVDVVDALTQATWANHNGWYLDLPAVGERLLKPIEFYDGTNILAVYSQVPARGSDVDPDVESCESSTVDEERQFRTLINIMDGKRPSVQLVDKNHDGLYNASDLGVSRIAVSKGSHTLITQGNKVLDIDTKNNKETLARMPEQSLRPSWRQVK
ncbi:MAG: PilC/PilY family type IV pilus protein [Comamonadaceae bacterium]|nr:pilus assembly protein PilC [Burkholderiales bacterium]MEB2347429.1 PilC/PilY family type IV pilus protein [Comamonadaceae bacterium]